MTSMKCPVCTDGTLFLRQLVNTPLSSDGAIQFDSAENLESVLVCRCTDGDCAGGECVSWQFSFSGGEVEVDSEGADYAYRSR